MLRADDPKPVMCPKLMMNANNIATRRVISAFNLSTQLSNFYKNAGKQERKKTEFHDSNRKVEVMPTNYTKKRKAFETLENWIGNNDLKA